VKPRPVQRFTINEGSGTGARVLGCPQCFSSQFRGGVVTHELVMGTQDWVGASGSEESSCPRFGDRTW
jgi:hypothetical protein